MFPTALTCPPVVTLPATMLPVALTIPPALTLRLITFPDELTVPVAMKFPPVVLPVTARFTRFPTVVKLENNTFELSVFPVINDAAGLETTPVIKLPLPSKKPPAMMLPVAEITEFASNVPVTVAPVPDTTSTFATPVELTLTVESSTMLILELPLVMSLSWAHRMDMVDLEFMVAERMITFRSSGPQMTPPTM